jgi:hypothetical protein
VRKTVANKGKRPTTLTRGAVKRIARAVNAYERGDRDIPPRKFRSYAPAGGSDVRRCETQDVWVIGEDATLDVIDGRAGETLVAKNHVSRVESGEQVLVAQSLDDGEWYLIAAAHEAVDVITSVALTDAGLVFERKRIWAVRDATELDDITIAVVDCEE